MKYIEAKRILRLVFISFVGLHIMLLLVPIIVPIFALFWVASQLSFLVVKIKYGSKVTKPSGMDIVNGKETDISKPYINIVGRFSTRNPDIIEYRQRFTDAILEMRDENGKRIFDKFTKIFEHLNGYYVWKEAEDFDLKNHFNLVDPNELLSKYSSKLNSREEKLKTERDDSSKTDEEEEINDLSGLSWETITHMLLMEYGAKPVKKGCPKWEILILPETNNRYTGLFRIHHSITDGLYFVRLIAECLADKPVEIRLPYNTRKPTFLQSVLMNLWSFSLLPYGLYKMIGTNDRNPLHGPKLTGKKNFLLSEPIPLELLKEIKKGTKITINDILFSCVSHATSSHFARRNCFVQDMNVLLAVNLQQQNKPLRLKNDFAVTSLKLPTSPIGPPKNNYQYEHCRIFIEPTSQYDLSKLPALARLQVVKNTLDDAKRDPSLMSVCWLLTSFSSLLPASVAEFILSTEGITMDISNVQGPHQKDLYLNNAPADDIAFWLSDRDPLGIGVSITSYNGTIRAGLIVDHALMEKEEEGVQFLDDFREAVFSLHSEMKMVKSVREKEANEQSLFLMKDILN